MQGAVLRNRLFFYFFLTRIFYDKLKALMTLDLTDNLIKNVRAFIWKKEGDKLYFDRRQSVGLKLLPFLHFGYKLAPMDSQVVHNG
jgi:hypothetical protein